jgi:hypothetical protein
MKYTLKDLWNLACKHDSIEPSSKFVVFSADNPWMKKYNTLLTLREAKAVDTTHVFFQRSKP